MQRPLKQYLINEGGATAIEYGLLAAMAGLAIITMISGLNGQLAAKFVLIQEALSR